MLTSILNAQRVGKQRVAVPYSRFSEEVLNFLKTRGVIGSVRMQESPRSKLVVTLAYDSHNSPRIAGLKRLSKPGRKLYVKHDEIPFTYHNFGFMVLSSSKGIIDEKTARKDKLGGELICAIW